MLKTTQRLSKAALSAAVFTMLTAQSAFAATGGGTMPWEGPLATISESLQGPVAYAVAIIGFIVAAVAFVIQGEMTGIMKKLVQAVMGMAVLLSVVTLINSFFGVSGAVIF